LPTTPAASSSGSRPASGLSSTEPCDPEREVIVRLCEYVEPAAFGLEYGAQLVDSTDWHGFTFLPGGGETPESLAGRVQLDPRVITAERNGYLESPEARQQSVAFDDGLGSPQACADQPAMAYLDVTSALRVSNGAGVRVAILDTGAELTHPALSG